MVQKCSWKTFQWAKKPLLTEMNAPPCAVLHTHLSLSHIVNTVGPKKLWCLCQAVSVNIAHVLWEINAYVMHSDTHCFMIITSMKMTCDKDCVSPRAEPGTYS